MGVPEIVTENWNSPPRLSGTAGAAVPFACKGVSQMRSACPSCVTEVNLFATCSSMSGKRGLVKNIASYVNLQQVMFAHLTVSKSVRHWCGVGLRMCCVTSLVGGRFLTRTEHLTPLPMWTVLPCAILCVRIMEFWRSTDLYSKLVVFLCRIFAMSCVCASIRSSRMINFWP